MKWLTIVFIIILSYLQYRLWLGDGSAANLLRLQTQIEEQSAENSRLKARNQILVAEVEALKKSDEAIEERARADLGLIKTGETFFMIIEPSKQQ